MEDERPGISSTEAFSRTYQRYSLPAQRAEQLAQEVAILNDAMLDLLPQLQLEDDPATFLSVLEAGKQTPPKSSR